MDNRYEIAEQNGMSREFADWFFDNKKDGCGNEWFVMMAAMWEGWKGRAAIQSFGNSEQLDSVNLNEPVSDTYKLRGIMPDFDGVAMSQRECYPAGLEAGKAARLPDGWVAVPVEPTVEMVKKMRYHCGGYDKNIKDGYKAMLAAAPQQEVKP